MVGVAPHAVIISIRQSSRAFEPVNPGPGDSEVRKKAGSIASLATAIVHAANMGAKVINISVTSCVSAADPLDQAAIGAAVWYAATVKDAVIVAAAGNDSEDGCAQNPSFDPLDASDPRDWHQVKTVSSPSWFSDYVLSVGAVDNTGAPISKSLAGPWVAAAAPGVGIMGLSPQTGGPVNAYPPIHPGEKNMPIWGTSFSAAYVSGVAALVRAKYPTLSAHQIINRILQTAHNPAARRGQPSRLRRRRSGGCIDLRRAGGGIGSRRGRTAGSSHPPRRRHHRITVPAAPHWSSPAWSWRSPPVWP
ncbi:hypothetical protein IWGMT90018_62380 [Mycobacterium kiyosense]|nr:hypothetical protein IWGMT90018_62380 [Mycobacterium kiyosense]